ncbi:MAG TPA: hypothetical protein VK601_17490 [Kofleriaceae bacterium]|nr:hypothetical protein [Kofleriaceae bacterium]
MSDLTKAVDLVRQARAEWWNSMAAKLPDHHVLAVEMFRVDRDQTLAVFTLVRNGKVVQEVLRGDGRGLNVQPAVQLQHEVIPLHIGRMFHVEAMLLATAAAATGGGEPYAVAIGEPPPKQPTEPGILAVGGTGMQNVFDTGEFVTGGSTK